MRTTRAVDVSLLSLSVVYHDLEHIDLGRNIQRQDIKRKARHIGVPDHGGIQRLIATGGITKSLNAKTDRFGYSDSIDVVFPVYWMYPAKTRVLTEKDIKCVKAYRELAKKGMYGFSHRLQCFYFIGFVVFYLFSFTTFCLFKYFELCQNHASTIYKVI